jgi:hypothetical protein
MRQHVIRWTIYELVLLQGIILEAREIALDKTEVCLCWIMLPVQRILHFCGLFFILCFQFNQLHPHHFPSLIYVSILGNSTTKFKHNFPP